jgi:hypothetical protein|tara:strand:+ start:2479 stop:2643 length:165 start_codon:yes stop_codon:yes gene_type:complete
VKGLVAKKIRKLIGYDKNNDNPVQRKLYKKLKGQYLALGAKRFWESVEGRFNNK